MRARDAVGIVIAAVGACACGESVQPAGPSLARSSGAAQVAPPAQPTAPASTANAAPTISGPDKCISPLGEDHIFDLEFKDQDGDAISWTATKRHASGRLNVVDGGPFASGTAVRLIYFPPRGEGDENWITVTATDARGATAEMKLFVKNH
jgi:hypothetical protein